MEREVNIDIHLITYVDDVSCIIIVDLEADLQVGIDVMLDQFEQYFLDIDFVTQKMVVDALILSTIMFCLAILGWKLDWRRTNQR